jgi:hypothetical protein
MIAIDFIGNSRKSAPLGPDKSTTQQTLAVSVACASGHISSIFRIASRSVGCLVSLTQHSAFVALSRVSVTGHLPAAPAAQVEREMRGCVKSGPENRGNDLNRRF